MAAAAGAAASGTTVAQAQGVNGGRFDFDDGGTYCGGWEDGKAHGAGVCTGPKGQGEYSGSWHFGFEVSGVYTWPSGSFYEGHWQNGKRHGLGVESRGRWLYRGEWTQGFKGRYGVRQSTTTAAKYEGTWANGLQDGYGSETYADGGTYQPGVEESPKVLSNGSAKGDSAEVRGGFVLKSRSDEAPVRRRSLVERTGMKNLMQGLKIRKQRSTGDLDRKGVMGSIRSTGSTSSWMSSESNYAGASVMSEGSQASFVVEDEMLDANVTETYMGEWKNDKRCGFGISERSDGLKKYGYGVTTFKDGSREEGKYKNNILITSNKKKHLFLIRSAKFRERIDSAVNAAQRASKIALQKADIAISRTATARGKAEQADYAAVCANEDSTEARTCASNFAPEFKQPGALLSESGTSGPGARSSAHGPPPALKLELPGTGRAGPGPPSPRGAMAGGGPGPPSASPQPPMANHVSVMSKPQAPVPAPPSSLDVRSQNHVAPQPPAPAPAPAPKPLQPPPKASIAPPRNNPPVSPPPSASDRPSAPTIPLLSAPAPRTEVPQASHPDPAVLRQPQSLQVKPRSPAQPRSYPFLQPVAQPEPRGRTPTRQERSRLTAQNDNGAAPAAGGYNFQKIMDDRFEHYKRPASRERSQDPGGRAASRGVSGSRDAGLQRAGSRQRTPMEPSFSDIKPSAGALDGLGLEGNHATKNGTGNGAANGAAGLDFKLPAEDQIRFRGVQQEIPHFGAPPKRTESLYMKPGEAAQPQLKALGSSAMQRKKSLPDVATLPTVTVKQGSQAMTREEISVLSSARREEIRRQLDEAERYRANPVLYIFNPHIREWFSRQQLMMVVLFVNVTLAIMFFKLLT